MSGQICNSFKFGPRHKATTGAYPIPVHRQRFCLETTETILSLQCSIIRYPRNIYENSFEDSRHSIIYKWISSLSTLLPCCPDFWCPS